MATVTSILTLADCMLGQADDKMTTVAVSELDISMDVFVLDTARGYH